MEAPLTTILGVVVGVYGTQLPNKIGSDMLFEVKLEPKKRLMLETPPERSFNLKWPNMFEQLYSIPVLLKYHLSIIASGEISTKLEYSYVPAYQEEDKDQLSNVNKIDISKVARKITPKLPLKIVFGSSFEKPRSS